MSAAAPLVSQPRKPAENTLPAAIAELAGERIHAFGSSAEQQQWLEQKLVDSHFAKQLQRVWGCSDYCAQQANQHPELFMAQVESGELEQSWSRAEWDAQLAASLVGCRDEEQLGERLRQFRRRAMLRIVWRDFAGLAPLLETTADMSALAEACVRAAINYLAPLAQAQWGQPIGRESGEPQQLLVLGMGKLGGYELNVSSDIDLIFAYPERGETQPVAGSAARSIDNQTFFIKLGQKLIKALDAPTVEGFVFRVDMRLRPYGQSGALVLNFDAIEEYYLTQGREWERYAMVKARVIAGPVQAAAELMATLRPFVYRKYLDYGAIDALRELQQNIRREVAHQQLDNNIKRGAGGIREVEFIAQALQIIRGGRERQLQTPELAVALAEIVAAGIWPQAEIDNLWQSYQFLRHSEHAIQAINDRQSQQLPSDELDQLRLAVLAGAADWPAYLEQLQGCRQQVSRCFDALFAAPDEDEQKVNCDCWPLHGERAELEAPLVKVLGELGYDDAASAANALLSFSASRAVDSLAREPRQRLDRLIPKIIPGCSGEQATQTLLRLLKLIESVLRRSAYLALLNENPAALAQLLRLCRGSSFIAEQLTRYPVLLDELLDAGTLYTPSGRTALQEELANSVLRIADSDLEEQMNALRYFVSAHKLRVAACDLTDVLPVMQVSDYLTWLAEVAVEYAIELGWRQLVERHGEPGSRDGRRPGFIAVGYGKLGGIELGYNSDLDMVFIHNADNNLATSAAVGQRQIDNATFFTRLGQRVIHILATQTQAGSAYEVDLRLRPSGNSGQLVVSLEGFAKYQREQAWTWEQQALVRARCVAGDTALAEQFAALRQQLLCRPRERAVLRQEVVAMRDKMRQHLGSSPNAGLFDLKQDAGGIVDIEFMVQFALLFAAHKAPQLVRWSDNIRLLEALAEGGQLAPQSAAALTQAYKAYRSAGHRLQLQAQPARLPNDALLDQRAAVQAVWAELMGAETD